MILRKCDKCGSLERPTVKSNDIGTGSEDWFYIRTTVTGSHVYIQNHLCKPCANKLKISRKNSRPTIEARLLEILEEIAEDAVENCEGCE